MCKLVMCMRMQNASGHWERMGGDVGYGGRCTCMRRNDTIFATLATLAKPHLTPARRAAAAVVVHLLLHLMLHLLLLLLLLLVPQDSRCGCCRSEATMM